MPLDASYVWGWYIDLSAARSTGMTANPISFTEIDAYCRLHHLSMNSWEVALLRRLDALALAAAAGKGDAGQVAQAKSDKPPATAAEAAEAKARVRAAFKDRRVVKRQPNTEQGS